MSAGFPPPSPAELPDECAHPWLRVTCGECGAAVDALRRGRPSGLGEMAPVGAGVLEADRSQALFIVARGHPELVEQLKSVMGHGSAVQIIEDRRRAPREVSEEAASAVRTEFRRRALEIGGGDSD